MESQTLYLKFSSCGSKRSLRPNRNIKHKIYIRQKRKNNAIASEAHTFVNWLYGANIYDAKIAVGQALILKKNSLELSSSLKASLEPDSSLEDVLRILLSEREPAIKNNVLRNTVADILYRFGGRVAGRESSKAFAAVDFLMGTSVFSTFGLSYGPIAGTLVMKIYAYLIEKGGVNAWEELLNKFGINRNVTAFVDNQAEQIFLAEYIPKIVDLKKSIKSQKTMQNGRWVKVSQLSRIAAHIRQHSANDFARFLCDKYKVQVKSECPETSIP